MKKLKAVDMVYEGNKQRQKPLYLKKCKVQKIVVK